MELVGARLIQVVRPGHPRVSEINGVAVGPPITILVVGEVLVQPKESVITRYAPNVPAIL